MGIGGNRQTRELPPHAGHVSNFRGVNLRRSNQTKFFADSNIRVETCLPFRLGAQSGRISNTANKVQSLLFPRSLEVDTLSGEPYHPGMGPISETYRYIVRSAGVRSGSATVEGTRIAVHDVIGLLQNGETLDTLRENCFPQLSRSQVYECLAYYEDHRGEIDLLVAKQTARASE